LIMLFRALFVQPFSLTTRSASSRMGNRYSGVAAYGDQIQAL
jgi:hypothetical protein